MLSPAILRLCCLAVMAPALTKAVRQADGLALLLMPQKNLAFLTSKIEHLYSKDHAAALNGPGNPLRTSKGGLSNGAFLSNGDLRHSKPYAFNQSLENIRKVAANEFNASYLSPSSKCHNNVNGHWNNVGVSTPTIETSEFSDKMSDDIPVTQERMGLLNANTSLDCDFQSKNFSHQCVSPVSLHMSPSESELLRDVPTECPVGELVTPLGSPKSASGESTSTITAHNPPVVTFAELEEAKICHRKIELRARELLHRVRKLQIFQVDSHIVSQLKSLVSHYQKVLSIPCQQQAKPNVIRRAKDLVDVKAEFLQNEDVRNLSTAALVSLVRKLESSNSSNKLLLSNRNLLSEVEESLSSENVDVRLNPEECEQIRHVTGSLLMQVNHLESAVDSDVTESSSGGESCDELEGYDDKKTNTTPIHKRAMWTWAFERAPIARRWTWLQSQVQDLEYRVRQIADLLAQARIAKGSTCFEEMILSESPPVPSTLDHSLSVKKALRSVNGYLDYTSVVPNSGFHSVQNVPPSSESCQGSTTERSCAEDCSSVSRTRPFKSSVFRKRKLLRTAGLHLVSRKAARLSTVNCNCNTRSDVMPCILCSGRYNNIQSVDPDVMPLLERMALLQPSFHPMLSFEKDAPLSIHFENHLRKSEAYYSVPKPGPSLVKKPSFGMKPRGLLDHARHHSRKLTKHAAQTLISSERYRNSRYSSRSSSRLSNRGIMFKKWRELNKGPFKKKHYRRWSAASSCSSRQESPEHSPSALEDGMLLNSLSGKENSLHEIMKKRRDGHQFDIDNIVIPYNIKTASSFQKLQYKEIITPKWRYFDENYENGPFGNEEETSEDVSEEAVTRRHERMEVEERKHLRGGGSSAHLGLSGSRRGRRNFRYDSRADSSGANTPDHLSYYHQDIMFQDSNSFISGGPISPVMSPPATPGSVNATSDDSQPSGSHTASTSERKRTASFVKRERSTDDGMHLQVQDDIDYPPFETRMFPLSDQEWDDMVKESQEAESPPDPLEEDDEHSLLKDPSSPGSYETSSSTSSALEDDDDDIADPEWTVVRRQNGPDRTLVIKLAKR